MKIGFEFCRNGSEYTIALFGKTAGGNAALLVSPAENGCVTVSNIDAREAGDITWELGCRAANYRDALTDFLKRTGHTAL